MGGGYWYVDHSDLKREARREVCEGMEKGGMREEVVVRRRAR